MNDKLLPELNNTVSVKVWELSCLLVACVLLGFGAASRQIAETGHNPPATAVLTLALAVLAAPVARQVILSRRKAMAKPANDTPKEPDTQ